MPYSAVKALPMLAILTFSTACAAKSTTREGADPRVEQSSRDRITSAEIEATAGGSAHDLVQKLRPHWLRQGGTASIGGGMRTQVTLVYLDGVRLGGLDALRSIPNTSLIGLEWIAATRASVVLRDIGNQPIAGVISVSTRR